MVGADDYFPISLDAGRLMAHVDNLHVRKNMLKNHLCNPTKQGPEKLSNGDDFRILFQKCIELIQAHLHEENFNVAQMADFTEMSQSVLYKKVNMASGVNLNTLIRFFRLQRAAELFISSGLNIRQTTLAVGIKDIRYFREQFSLLFNATPSEYIKVHRGSF